MKRILFFAILSLCFSAIAQNNRDTTLQLNEVSVKAYFSEQPILRSPASVGILDARQLANQPGTSLVSGINTIPGVRMEERSPGSYRLSIRGSLLRSPFGIRNIKIYMDEFPFTDAGGNSYLNLLDASGPGRIEILKGPEASIFGANSGGVILIDPTDRRADSTLISAGISGGSFGLFQEKVLVQKQWKKYHFNLNQAYQESEGYRDNSRLQRNFLQTAQRFKYSASSELRALLVYSDLQYLTPGGLTQAQSNENPIGARAIAISQKAGIYNKTLQGGILNETRLSGRAKVMLALFGGQTDFKNPFITNYEVRRENTYGLRTYLELSETKPSLSWRLNVGLESQQTRSDITNYGNKQGIRDTVQASDRIHANQNFGFVHLTTDINSKIILEAASSLNFYNYRYGKLFPSETALKAKNFDVRLMPRIALSWQLDNDLAWRASISRGYSPPTIAEVRASDNIVNTDLQPENGWNYETGFRLRAAGDRFWIDGLVFYYHLQNAIARRLNASDTEYFINAGGTKQLGFESQLITWLLKPNSTKPVRSIQLRNSYTRSNFSFSNYKNATADYSGKRLTGVPENVLVSSLELKFLAGVYLFAQHNFTSNIPLNDVGTIYAEKYHLLQAKAGWKINGKKYPGLELYVGADNLLNSEYSLGNDLNAVGGRYFNPSPKRNYYFGISSNFRKN